LVHIEAVRWTVVAPLISRGDEGGPIAPPFNGFARPVTGLRGRPGRAVGGHGNPLIKPHRQAREKPGTIIQNPMFSRPKLGLGPCGQVPPSYMSVNHRNIADV